MLPIKQNKNTQTHPIFNKDISRLKIKEQKEMYCLNTNQEKVGVAGLISQSGKSKKNYQE